MWLKGVVRRGYQPNLLYRAVLPHVAGYDEVANMHGIEGAEKECYLHRLMHRFYHNLFSLAEAEAKVVACHQY